MEEINKLLNMLLPTQQARFALYCALDVVKYRQKDDILSKKCVDLIESWLKDKSSVSPQQLIDVASATYAAYSATNSAAYGEKITQYTEKLRDMIANLSKLEKEFLDI